MNSNSLWAGVALDIIVVLAVTALAFQKVIPSEVVTTILAAVLTARATRGSGGGPTPPAITNGDSDAPPPPAKMADHSTVVAIGAGALAALRGLGKVSA